MKCELEPKITFMEHEYTYKIQSLKEQLSKQEMDIKRLKVLVNDLMIKQSLEEGYQGDPTPELDHLME